MLTIGIVSLLLYSSYNKISHIHVKNIYRISGIIILYSIIILYNSTNIIYIGKSIILFNDLIVVSSYSTYIKLLLLILTLVYIIIKYEYMNININSSLTIKNTIEAGTQRNQPGYVISQLHCSNDYILLILFNLLGMSIFIESYNLLLIYIAIELQSYSIYIITSRYNYIYKSSKLNYELMHGGGTVGSYRSSKSGLIYFLLGSLASIIILIGLTLLYNVTGLTNLYDINIYLNEILLINGSNVIDNLSTLELGYLLIFIGLLFKIGIAPLHNWLINIYVNVPTIVTIWISLVTKISILTFIYTILYNSQFIYNNYTMGNTFNIIYILSILSVLSMCIGGLGGLSQINIKRIIAYSGLANIGYMLYAIIANNQLSLQAYIFNISQYSLTHINWFLIILLSIIPLKYSGSSQFLLNLRSGENTSNYNDKVNIANIQNIIGYTIRNPYLLFSYVITLSSLIGIPPLTGFYGKYYIIISGIYSGYILSTIVLIFISGVTAYYYSFIMNLNIFKLYNKRNSITNLETILQRGSDITGMRINITYLISYIVSIITFITLLPILLLDIYTNGASIIDYHQYTI